MGLFDKFIKRPETGEAVNATMPGAAGGADRTPVEFGKYEQEINARFETLFPGREKFMFRETISDRCQIEINIMAPTSAGNYYVVYTTGLSDLPMPLPEELAEQETLTHAELYCFLPASWNPVAVAEHGDEAPENDLWPVKMVRFLAGQVHNEGKLLHNGLMLPNGEEYEAICSEAKMGGYVLSQLDGDIGGVLTNDETAVNFLMVIPAYREEIRYGIIYGMDELNRRYDSGKLPMVANLRRPNLCATFNE